MKHSLTKSQIMQNGHDIYTSNWLDLGKMIGGTHKVSRYRMTDSQIRFVVLTLLNRNLLGIKNVNSY